MLNKNKMSVKVKKRKGENFNSLLYRFNRKIKRSGILREARKRLYFQKPDNKNKRKVSALYREEKNKEIEKLKRYGHGMFGRHR